MWCGWCHEPTFQECREACRNDMPRRKASNKQVYFIISAGFQGSQAIDVLKYSAMSATASLADQATVADALTSMMNAYKDSNISASVAANDLTKIEVYGKATLSAFASTLGFTMVTAHAAGLTIDEASASVATLSQVSGQHGIRRISNEFDNLARSMLDVNAVQKRVQQQMGSGFQFNEAAFAADTFIQKLQYLAQVSGGLKGMYNQAQLQQDLLKASTMSDADAKQYLALKYAQGNSAFLHMVGGAAAFIPALILLSGKSAEYNKILLAMQDRTDIVTAAFNNMRNTLNQQLKMLGIRIENIGIALGYVLLPAVQTVTKGLIAAAGGLLAWVNTGTQHMDTIIQSVKGLGIVIAVFLVPPLISAAIAAAPLVAVVLAFIAAGYLMGKVLDYINSQFGGFAGVLKAAHPVLQVFVVALQDAKQQSWACSLTSTSNPFGRRSSPRW